ncbi:MAG TPA: porin [Terriglobales bacterium]|nr:porin [Terriglobales bacterium]
MPAQIDAAAVMQRMAELEKEVELLRGELRAVKAAPSGTATLRPAVYTPTDGSDNPPASAATPAAAPAAQKPDPLAGLASVLGGATVVGLVDGYYGYNFNKPELGTTSLSAPSGNFTSLRLFDSRNNQFALNLIELGLVKTPDADNRLGYKAIFGFGDAMEQVNVLSGGDPSFLRYLKEAYFSYLAPVGKGLQINVGKFVTPNGAEVIESNANWNYSRSLLFNYAIPFYHYGIQAQYTFNPKFSMTGYVVNGWNDVVHDPSTGYFNSGKTGGLTFVWTATKKLTFTENWMGGPGATQVDGSHWRNLFDTVIAYNLNSKWSFQLNGDYGRVEGTTLDLANPNKSVDWWGAAGYIKYQFNPKYAFATRYEYYNDPNRYTTGCGLLLCPPGGTGPFDPNGHGPHIQEVTATLERRIATHLITRLEYRHDESNQAFFPKGKATNPFVNGQNTMAIGMMFVLEPNEAAK